MNIKHKIALSVGTGVVAAQLLAGATFAATNVKVSGNGWGSWNDVDVHSFKKWELTQSNSQYVGTDIDVYNKTGGNKAKYNTGGDVKLKTGKIENDVAVVVTGGTNKAHQDECGCQPNSVDVKVKDNGAKTKNEVDVSKKDITEISQSNTSKVHTEIEVKNNSGDNSASGNTGKHSDVVLKTGNIDNDVNVFVGGSSNILK